MWVQGKSTSWAASKSTCSLLEAQNDLPLFLVVFSRLLFCVAMVKPLVSYFKANGPCRCLRDGYRIWVRQLRLFSSCPIPPTTLFLLRYFLRTTTARAKQKITQDELSARAKTNVY